MTLDAGRLSCGFDSGTASDGTVQMRMLCTDLEEESLMYGAQLKLLPGKKIELILSRWIKSDERSAAFITGIGFFDFRARKIIHLPLSCSASLPCH